jgi:hypothetical protein
VSAFAQILASAIADYRANPSEASREEMHRARLAAVLNDAIDKHRKSPSDEGAARLRAARDALRECLGPKVQSRSTQERQTTTPAAIPSLMSKYLPEKTSPTTSLWTHIHEHVLHVASVDPLLSLFVGPIKPLS